MLAIDTHVMRWGRTKASEHSNLSLLILVQAMGEIESSEISFAYIPQ